MPIQRLQPIITDAYGVKRFRANAIVRYLLDAGPFNLNDLGLMPFADEDRQQFAQLIGYSISGYGDLPEVSKEACAQADMAAEGLTLEAFAAHVLQTMRPGGFWMWLCQNEEAHAEALATLNDVFAKWQATELLMQEARAIPLSARSTGATAT